MSFFFNKPVLGVDIGTRTLKGVRLKSKGGRFYLDRHFFHDLASTSESYPDRPNIEETLRAAIELQRLNKVSAATGLKDGEIMTFNFVLPPLARKELDQAVEHELSEQSTVPVEELSIDYLTSQDTKSSEPRLNVKAYCAKKNMIRDRMVLLESATLKPSSIETEMLAITAMLEFNGYVTADQNYVVFDYGESHLSSGLISGNELLFARTAEISSGSINQALKAALNLDYSQAEELKLAYDFNAKPGDTDDEAVRIIDDMLTGLFQEAKSALEFFKDYSQETSEISGILLVGGGSQTRNLAKVHELFFKIPTTVVNPFRNIEIYPSTRSSQETDFAKIAPYMSTAVGLALTGMKR